MKRGKKTENEKDTITEKTHEKATLWSLIFTNYCNTVNPVRLILEYKVYWQSEVQISLLRIQK